MDKKVIPYRHELVELAREFRNNPTKAEKILWQKLKGKQVLGYDFHRQKPIGYYVVDFFCLKLMLAIELDGNVHETDYAMLRDERRQDSIMDEFGIRFLRFRNFEIEKNVDGVVREIEEWIRKNKE
ncbi:MAG TPA: endonuclease domain-containing protein [Bacteroidia bacterium]|nr:endonuclease domain-containing protein [Bacteroidia bacterium]